MSIEDLSINVSEINNIMIDKIKHKFKTYELILNKCYKVIRQGVRCLDFEIYSINERPVIAVSSINDYNFKQSYNYLDLYDAAKVILESFNITSISGGDRCTYSEAKKYFSYRRDGVDSGRMAHLIWLK